MMKTRLYRWLGAGVAAASLFMAAPAFAGNAGYGAISNIISDYLGGITFTHSATHASNPCSGPSWFINGATAAGQPMVATLLTAYSSGKRISIVGTGACTGSNENIAYFMVEN